MKNRPTCYIRHPYRRKGVDNSDQLSFDAEHAKIINWLNAVVGRDNWGYINNAFLFANEHDASWFALTWHAYRV